MTARERGRRLAVLEAAATLKAKADADAAVNAAFDAIMASLTRTQLRAVLELARDVRAGKLTEAEAAERLVAVPGVEQHFPQASPPPAAT